jgi:hypothetical protein
MTRPKYRPSLAMGSLLLFLGAASAQNVKFKSVDGKVFGNNDTPLPNAIVYLQDSRDTNIRTFIATQNGSYRFGQLSPDIDYTVWAKYKDAKSPTRTISSFDSRQQFTIDLHIKTDK